MLLNTGGILPDFITLVLFEITDNKLLEQVKFILNSDVKNQAFINVVAVNCVTGVHHLF
jgi:hypothetical protein